MKAINCPKETRIEKKTNKKSMYFQTRSYMRCINKNDLSYVDIPICRGLNTIKNLYPLLKKADDISGNFKACEYLNGKWVHYKKMKKYHYFVLLTVDKNGNIAKPLNNSFIGVIKKKDGFYRIEVEPDNNKIVKEHKLIKVKGGGYTITGDNITVDNFIGWTIKKSLK